MSWLNCCPCWEKPKLTVAFLWLMDVYNKLLFLALYTNHLYAFFRSLFVTLLNIKKKLARTGSKKFCLFSIIIQSALPENIKTFLAICSEVKSESSNAMYHSTLELLKTAGKYVMLSSEPSYLLKAQPWIICIQLQENTFFFITLNKTQKNVVQKLLLIAKKKLAHLACFLWT